MGFKLYTQEIQYSPLYYIDHILRVQDLGSQRRRYADLHCDLKCTGYYGYGEDIQRRDMQRVEKVECAL